MSNTRKKIMIIDDNNAVLQMGKELLADSYDILPLPSAEKMFEALEKVTPDLFMLDIKMPGASGFEIIEKLKSDRRYAKIPVIFLTGSYAVENAVKGFGLGAVDYITKPFRNPEFINTVKKHLETPGGADLTLPNPGSTSSGTDLPSSSTGEKPAILVVDDSPDILKAVYTILQDGYKVYTLKDPEKLEEFLKKTTPDLFLLDYNMPKLTGFDLVPTIRKQPKHSNTPIIFLTGDATKDRITQAIGLGACDYVIKPFDAEILRKKVARWIMELA